MIPDIQAILENESLLLIPLAESDFEALYSVASDPKIWEQHPNRDRWKREVFANFFEGAMLSKGAYKIVQKDTGALLGSTRFYDYDATENSILIGYTFYSTQCWGKGLNPQVKKLMLDYILQFVSRVYFHVGSVNVRSQVALTRLGAKKITEKELAYHGEPTRLNYVYGIDKSDWLSKS